ncbi:MAG TPA: hypothetical protein VG297_15785 [Bryobacteraceae bacterium]|jgi:hypothetical protein|nr:hypothetical protein [Bryobacteraceae bacterium]
MANCEPISVALQVDPPSGDSEIVFQLDKICNNDDTAEWKMHFELKQKNAQGTLAPVVTLDIDINKEDHPAAEATAANGLDEDQRAQAQIAGVTSLGTTTGDATKEDAQTQAAAIIPARTT